MEQLAKACSLYCPILAVGVMAETKVTHRKDERNAPPHSLGSIKVSLGAEEEVLLALGRLP